MSKRPKREPLLPLQPRRLLTVAEAAELLSTTPTALRARCRRHARRMGREVVALLGAGVTAFKLGTSWRLRIESLAFCDASEPPPRYAASRS